MKRICLVLITLLVLVGCSSKEYSAKNYAQLSDGSEVLFTAPDNKSFTKQDLFNTLKNYDMSTTITSAICNKIGYAEGLDMETYEKGAEEYVATFVENGAEYVINYYGGEKMMYETYIASMVMDEFRSQYAELNFDSSVAENHPVKAQLAYFDVLEDAQSFIEMVNEGSSFEMAAAENGYGYEASEKIYTDSDDLTLEVKDYLLNNASIGMSDIIISVTTTKDSSGNTVEAPRYYVLNVISSNVDEFRDDYLKVLADGIDSDTILNYMFKKHNIEFYDQRTYELMTSSYEGLN